MEATQELPTKGFDLARPNGTVDDSVAAAVTPQEVRAQLERIISSPLFCKSKRLSRFLTFVVESSLAGHAEELKERTLAMEVFDREPDYDSTSDPIVRVAAGDLRKRLAQYYVQQPHSSELRILLPAGHYRPLFQYPAAAVSFNENLHVAGDLSELEQREDDRPKAPPASSDQAIGPVKQTLPWRAVFLGASLMCLLATVVSAITWSIYFYTHRPQRELQNFWAPLQSDAPALLCVGDWDKSLLSNLTPSERADVVRMLGPRSMVGPGNLSALFRISGLLGEFGKPGSVAMADSVSLTDLRSSPAVLIGIFENPWTSRVLRGERFYFEARKPEDPYSYLKDVKNPSRNDWKIDQTIPLPALQRDYALITRKFISLTGQTDYVIAGLSPYGTIAASEFVTRPEYFRQFADVAPRGWQNQDIQIVVGTDLVNGRSAPPQMLAFDVR